ncbi:MAG: PhzF family phenazine biosynthesis protein [Chryseolinea sp.]
MKIKMYQIDAFTDRVFGGNPAAVCPLSNWIDDELMQNIAMENNLAETAFFVKNGDVYEIRWFTPTVEVDLCGHATLASAFVLFNYLEHHHDEIVFHSHRSGELLISRKEGLITLNFPTDTLTEVIITDPLVHGFPIKPIKAFKGKTHYLFIYRDEHEVLSLSPVFQEIVKLDCRGIIVTARGSESDFVSRFFAPQIGVNEDPVTGSAHTSLIPYWSNELKRNALTAIQLSSRRGHLQCKYLSERVEISGYAKAYLQGEIVIE